MNAPPSLSPKIAETVVADDVRLREVEIGRCCEILGPSSVEYTGLGDYSYIGQGCMVADATIGKFCAIAANVRIGAPNHPIDRPSQHRFTYCPEYYSAAIERDHRFFARRRADKVTIGHDVWIGHGAILLPGITNRKRRSGGCWGGRDAGGGTLHDHWRRARARDPGALHSVGRGPAAAHRLVALAIRSDHGAAWRFPVIGH
jgi:hypothetical protein